MEIPMDSFNWRPSKIQVTLESQTIISDPNFTSIWLEWPSMNPVIFGTAVNGLLAMSNVCNAGKFANHCISNCVNKFDHRSRCFNNLKTWSVKESGKVVILLSPKSNSMTVQFSDCIFGTSVKWFDRIIRCLRLANPSKYFPGICDMLLWIRLSKIMDFFIGSKEGICVKWQFIIRRNRKRIKPLKVFMSR